MEDVFNLDNSQASSFLDKKSNTDDGLLRPKLEEGKDGKRELLIRFLPNLTKSGKIGPTAIEKHIHYADFKNNPELQGYYDCLKNSNIGKECPLCKTYWNLKNSKNPETQDKAKKISRSTKYYSYALVVEDKQKPENEGKIFIFPFGYKIFQKIESKAKSSRKPVKVEDLVHGANLNLVIQEVGGFYNYDASEFDAPEPIEFNGKMLEVNEDGSISKAEKQRVYDFLMSREHELDEFLPQEWTAEQYDKVDKIIAVLSGQSYEGMSSSAPSTTNTAKPLTSSAVFDDDDEDEDEEPEMVVKEVKAPKAPKKAPKKAEIEAEDEAVKKSSKKAAAFFDEDED